MAEHAEDPTSTRDYVVIKNPTSTGLNTETPNVSTVHPTVPAGR